MNADGGQLTCSGISTAKNKAAKSAAMAWGMTANRNSLQKLDISSPYLKKLNFTHLNK